MTIDSNNPPSAASDSSVITSPCPTSPCGCATASVADYQEVLAILVQFILID